MTINTAPPGKYTVHGSLGEQYYSTLVRLPRFVGGYQMGEFRFTLTRKPAWWHRLGVRLVLGWRWVDDVKG